MAAFAQAVYSTAIGTLERPHVGIRALSSHHRHLLGTFVNMAAGALFADVSKHRLAHMPSAQVPALGCDGGALARGTPALASSEEPQHNQGLLAG